MFGDPTEYDIVIARGQDWSETFTIKSAGVPVNLTGWTGEMDIDNPIITLSTASGGMVIGGSAGTIVVTLTAAQTSQRAPLLTAYRVKLADGSGKVGFPFKGKITWRSP